MKKFRKKSSFSYDSAKELLLAGARKKHQKLLKKFDNSAKKIAKGARLAFGNQYEAYENEVKADYEQELADLILEQTELVESIQGEIEAIGDGDRAALLVRESAMKDLDRKITNVSKEIDDQQIHFDKVKAHYGQEEPRPNLSKAQKNSRLSAILGLALLDCLINYQAFLKLSKTVGFAMSMVAAIVLALIMGIAAHKGGHFLARIHSERPGFYRSWAAFTVKVCLAFCFTIGYLRELGSHYYGIEFLIGFLTTATLIAFGIAISFNSTDPSHNFPKEYNNHKARMKRLRKEEDALYSQHGEHEALAPNNAEIRKLEALKRSIEKFDAYRIINEMYKQCISAFRSSYYENSEIRSDFPENWSSKPIPPLEGIYLANNEAIIKQLNKKKDDNSDDDDLDYEPALAS